MEVHRLFTTSPDFQCPHCVLFIKHLSLGHPHFGQYLSSPQQQQQNTTCFYNTTSSSRPTDHHHHQRPHPRPLTEQRLDPRHNSIQQMFVHKLKSCADVEMYLAKNILLLKGYKSSVLNSLPNWELSNGRHTAELLLVYVCAICRVLHSVEHSQP